MSSSISSKFAHIPLSTPIGAAEQIHGDGQGNSIPDGKARSQTLCEKAFKIRLSQSKEISHRQQIDAELIRRCLEGDREAWAALLDRYSGLIYSIAWKSHLAPEDVADVFQSVSLALLGGLRDLRDWTKLSSWLTQVTIHECLRVKRRQSWPCMSLDDVADEVANIPDESLLPDEMIERLEKQQLVRQALAMMDEPCRRLLTRLFLEKELRSYEDIARELGLSASTIGPKRGRCLKKLLNLLTKLGL